MNTPTSISGAAPTALAAPEPPRVAPPGKPQSLSGLLPFLTPYKLQIGMALLFLMLAAGATLAFPVALRYLIDGNTATGPGAQADKLVLLQGHFLALFGVAVALGLFSAVRFYFVSWIGERVTADLRNAVYKHVLQQSPEFFETTQTGEVLSRLTADTTLVQTVVGSSLSMGLRNTFMGVGALVMLIYTNPTIMTWVFGVLLLIVLPSLWFGRRVRKLSRASQDRVADTSAIASEVLNAVPTVQSYTAESRESARFDLATENAFATAIRRTRTRSTLIAFIIIATSAALLFGLYQGTQAVMLGRITSGHLGQTVIYVIILAGAFAVLGEVYGDIQRAAGATERLMELLHAKSPVQNPLPLELKAVQSSNESENPLNSAFVQHPRHSTAIHFDDVSFNYPSRPLAAALNNFSLRVERGETIALVGASGAGKTTVFQLIERFYDPQSGTVSVGGTSVKTQNLGVLREQVAIVSQESVIFSSSAMDNIRYGRPDATNAQVLAAATAAYAHDFISALPEGYNTFLGERGVRLSGGQRQRIAIARAILKDAPILLLDEATSALDAESERMVQAALDNAMGGHRAASLEPQSSAIEPSNGHSQRTTLVIAHRLATVQKADRIVVMDNGRIIETGTHASLLAHGGAYAKLAALQFNAPEPKKNLATLSAMNP